MTARTRQRAEARLFDLRLQPGWAGACTGFEDRHDGSRDPAWWLRLRCRAGGCAPRCARQPSFSPGWGRGPRL